MEISDILALYVNKRTAPYLLWTAIGLVAAIFLWLSLATPTRQKDEKGNDSCNERYRRRKVSAYLDASLLQAEANSAAQAVSSFIQLCASCEVFALAVAEDDAREREILKLLESVGAFDAGLQRHRVMFSSTDAGRASMVRQLQPAVHIEADSEIAAALEGKVPEVRLMGRHEWPGLEKGSAAAT
mmetsp:Transcript_35818/g.82212  ORF Transcript_35818/g.82212 Transcript_35818/m.82212 type:complete len:185 (+) Transcript_35818:50-604(+)